MLQNQKSLEEIYISYCISINTFIDYVFARKIFKWIFSVRQAFPGWFIILLFCLNAWLSHLGFYVSSCLSCCDHIFCPVGLPLLASLHEILLSICTVCHWWCEGMCVYIWQCIVSVLVCLHLCAHVVTMRGPVLVNQSVSSFLFLVSLALFCSTFLPF